MKTFAGKRFFRVFVPSEARKDGVQLNEMHEIIANDEVDAILQAFNAKDYRPGYYKGVIVVEVFLGGGHKVTEWSHRHYADAYEQTA